MKKIFLFIFVLLCSCTAEEISVNNSLPFYRLNQVDVNGQSELKQVIRTKASQRNLESVLETYSKYTELASLTMSGSSLSITDTLVIKGDLAIDKGSTMTISKNGVLIVVGNFDMASSHTSLLNLGNIYIGKVFNPIGNKVDNQGTIYACDRRNGNSINGKIYDGVNIKWRKYSFNCVGLPITIKSFTSNRIPEGILINFETSEEINSDYVEIQKSVDGVNNWSVITKIKSNGFGSKYQYIDRTK